VPATLDDMEEPVKPVEPVEPTTPPEKPKAQNAAGKIKITLKKVLPKKVTRHTTARLLNEFQKAFGDDQKKYMTDDQKKYIKIGDAVDDVRTFTLDKDTPAATVTILTGIFNNAVTTDARKSTADYKAKLDALQATSIDGVSNDEYTKAMEEYAEKVKQYEAAKAEYNEPETGRKAQYLKDVAKYTTALAEYEKWKAASKVVKDKTEQEAKTADDAFKANVDKALLDRSKLPGNSKADALERDAKLMMLMKLMMIYSGLISAQLRKHDPVDPADVDHIVTKLDATMKNLRECWDRLPPDPTRDEFKKLNPPA
jgi:hypothetical protein